MAATTGQTHWADEPFKLLDIPGKSHETKPHAAVLAAAEMAHVHNCLLRGLNSVMLQAPYIPVNGEPGYKKKDVLDLLQYMDFWIQAMYHHHDTEERFIFPKVEKIAAQPGLMDELEKQHASFHPGLEKLDAYAKNTTPEDYKWEGEDGMKAIIIGFADHLVEHLHHEIDVFMSLEKYDNAELTECFEEGTKQATTAGPKGMLYNMVPLILGGADKTYDGGNEWPPFPTFMSYAVHYWFGRRYSGAWRFNPSDEWSNPLPPQFLPKTTET